MPGRKRLIPLRLDLENDAKRFSFCHVSRKSHETSSSRSSQAAIEQITQAEIGCSKTVGKQLGLSHVYVDPRGVGVKWPPDLLDFEATLLLNQ